jgi:hypothetical protein
MNNTSHSPPSLALTGVFGLRSVGGVVPGDAVGPGLLGQGDVDGEPGLPGGLGDIDEDAVGDRISPAVAVDHLRLTEQVPRDLGVDAVAVVGVLMVVMLLLGSVRGGGARPIPGHRRLFMSAQAERSVGCRFVEV